MASLLRSLLNEGAIRPLSYFFARFLADEYRLHEDSLPVISAALVSERNQQGDVCIDLRDFAGGLLFESESLQNVDANRAPHYAQWKSALEATPAIGGPGDIAALIFEAPRLYLGKFWHFEARVREAVAQRLQEHPEIDESRLIRGLDRLFPRATGSAEPDWQKIACALAICRSFAVLSGGPGTGKTTTLVKVLALLLEQNPLLRIGLAAPTGKAAARMLEAIRARKSEIPVSEEIRARIPDQAATLHRLLEYDGEQFHANRDNPLVLDCLVIDEASMVDLPLIARTLDALPDSARLILLGDRDQLASVEAGNVLADFCGNGQTIEYSPGFARRLARLASIPDTGLATNAGAPNAADSIALLRTSYRFGAMSCVGRLADLVNQGEARQALQLLQQSEDGRIEWCEMSGQSIAPEVVREAVERYRDYLEVSDPELALERVEAFRVLCATRTGPAGVEELNRIIEERLFPEQRDRHPAHYRGKLLMVSVNDYETGLYNGDIGLVWPDPGGTLHACFRVSGEQTRRIPVRDLPEHVPAWAMTVHKSQGSEFDRVLLVLPDLDPHPVVCRELIYTAITRCRSKVTIHATRKAFDSGVKRRLRRRSGLGEKLGWSADPHSADPRTHSGVRPGQ